MCKHDLDAALKVLVDEAPGHCTPNDVIWLSHAFRAYHGEPKCSKMQFRGQSATDVMDTMAATMPRSAAKIEPKIEAGAVVAIAGDAYIGCLQPQYEVVAVIGGRAVLKRIDRHDGAGGVGRLRFMYGGMIIVAPATPEPGDFAQYRDGRTGTIGPISDYNSGHTFYVTSYPVVVPCPEPERRMEWWPRSDFTILMKAPKHE